MAPDDVTPREAVAPSPTSGKRALDRAGKQRESVAPPKQRRSVAPSSTREKKALDRVGSPDGLDRTLAVTSARGWIALLTIAAVVAATLAWSVGGQIATYVEAEGVILNRGGQVVDAVAGSRGRLSAIAVAEGDEIERGAIVGLIVDDEINERYTGALELIEERKRELSILEEALAGEDRVARENYDRYRMRFDELEASAVEMLDFVRDTVEKDRRLFESGIVRRAQLEQSRQRLNDARVALLGLRQDRDAMEANELKRANDNATRIREAAALVRDAERQADTLGAAIGAKRIPAPVSGRVVEIKTTAGAALAPGDAVASIRTGDSELEALLYIPPADGKRIDSGMPALVTPATVRREEYGSIKGTVESVSTFPASLDGMVAVLQNRSLALHLSNNGPPYTGRVVLEQDPGTASGFAWTSPRASTQKLTSGTLATVEIKTGVQPPITLAIPLLKEFFGIR